MPTAMRETYTAAVTVLEREPHWAPELIRELTPHRILVRACRSFADLDRHLAASPPAVAVIDFDSWPGTCLHWLADLQRRPFRPAVLLCGSENSAELEWLTRELGATAFLTEWRPAVEVARQCRQWVAIRQPSPVLADSSTPTENAFPSVSRNPEPSAPEN